MVWRLYINIINLSDELWEEVDSAIITEKIQYLKRFDGLYKGKKWCRLDHKGVEFNYIWLNIEVKENKPIHYNDYLDVDGVTYLLGAAKTIARMYGLKEYGEIVYCVDSIKEDVSEAKERRTVTPCSILFPVFGGVVARQKFSLSMV